MDGLLDGLDFIGELLALLLKYWYVTLLLILILLLALLHSGTDSTTKTQPRQSNAIVLYHYTSQQGMVGILNSEAIQPSGNVKYEPGVYLTDLPPTGLLTDHELATALFNDSRRTIDVQHFLELSVDTSLIQRVASVVWQPLPINVQGSVKGYSIYRLAGNYTLQINSIMLNSGDTVFR